MKPATHCPQEPRATRANDADFQAAFRRFFDDFAPAMAALARSEREDAAMAPEELALKTPHRR